MRNANLAVLLAIPMALGLSACDRPATEAATAIDSAPNLAPVEIAPKIGTASPDSDTPGMADALGTMRGGTATTAPADDAR